MAGVCDFIFLVDCTGSMQDCIDALKTNIESFIDGLAGAQSPVRDWRGKVVGYRDVSCDGSRWYEDNPFVQNDDGALKAQVAKLEATGGGDEPESLLDALYKISSMEQTDRGGQIIDPLKWRYRSDAARVVIVFTDATFQPTMGIPEASGGTVNDVANLLMANKVLLYLYAPDHECYDDLSGIPGCEYEPIAGPDFVQGLIDFSSDVNNFQKAMMALAKSVSKSVAAEIL